MEKNFPQALTRKRGRPMLEARGMIGQVIRAERLSRGWTQQEFADETGGALTAGAVSMIELGDRGKKMPFETAAIIAGAFGWSLDEFFAKTTTTTEAATA